MYFSKDWHTHWQELLVNVQHDPQDLRIPGVSLRRLVLSANDLLLEGPIQYTGITARHTLVWHIWPDPDEPNGAGLRLVKGHWLWRTYARALRDRSLEQPSLDNIGWIGLPSRPPELLEAPPPPPPPSPPIQPVMPIDVWSRGEAEWHHRQQIRRTLSEKREIINQEMAMIYAKRETAQLHLNHFVSKNRPSPRNIEIVRRAHNGESYNAIAKDYDVASTTIRDIYFRTFHRLTYEKKYASELHLLAGWLASRLERRARRRKAR